MLEINKKKQCKTKKNNLLECKYFAFREKVSKFWQSTRRVRSTARGLPVSGMSFDSQDLRRRVSNVQVPLHEASLLPHQREPQSKSIARSPPKHRKPNTSSWLRDIICVTFIR